MLKVYVVVELLKWDVYLLYVFFVYREVLNEIIGFILFEFFYVRYVRGFLDILKE